MHDEDHAPPPPIQGSPPGVLAGRVSSPNAFEMSKGANLRQRQHSRRPAEEDAGLGSGLLDHDSSRSSHHHAPLSPSAALSPAAPTSPVRHGVAAAAAAPLTGASVASASLSSAAVNGRRTRRKVLRPRPGPARARALASLSAGAVVVFLTLGLALHSRLTRWCSSLLALPQLRRRNSSFAGGGDADFSVLLRMASYYRDGCVPAAAFKSTEQFLSEHELLPDLNGLEISSLASSAEFARAVLDDHDRAAYRKERQEMLEAMNVHVGGIGRRYEDDFEYSVKHECRRNNWRSKKLPNCNMAHEVHNLDRTTEYDSIVFKGAGAFRNSWLFESPAASVGNKRRQQQREPQLKEQFVVKSMRLRSGLDADYSMLYQISKEAIIMERLSGSPRIVDIFGYCGTTVVAEYMNKQVTGDIVWGSEDWEGYAGWMKQKELDKLQIDDVRPMNNLTVDEKLDLAIVMAESIADIHGFEGGVIVHVRCVIRRLFRFSRASANGPNTFLRSISCRVLTG
jgi:hypothetical protein